MFDPTLVGVTCVTVPKVHCIQVPLTSIEVCGYSNQFYNFDHLGLMTSNDPKMTFDPTPVRVLCVALPNDHCI